MIYGFRTLFLIIPQLPQHMFSILPKVFKAILHLCKDTTEKSMSYENSSEDDDEILDVGIKKMIAEDRSIGSDYNSYESIDSYLEDEEVLYDSPLKKIDKKALINAIIDNL